MQDQTYYTYLQSPIGWIEIESSSVGITSLRFTESEPQREKIENKITLQCKTELEEYFRKERKQFSVSLAPEGSEFQQKVWKALNEIPYGTTTSYGKIAEILGDPHAVRAVGKANGSNPIAIIVPCHRVIGASGNLTGYAWGLDKKQWLLKLEQAAFQTTLF
ncbi:methylated-DNA--[protein]-cysteine S-methyltransferase [Sediminitomix flava]|uniref:Methylated-DNA--protein-cysteine methyltransferase n=1 Tax=Sediminitomix flava TaxID=379075 RepID=A0A316A047_SEDFL|nr:methylated-DNA--[protein]-cysteine S-methyltransferase [Sediminitomix flava]PWJ43017.1 methylated-DNA-[protein]-cysteine S-methyltransferase [Sediminitomix flava]